jgi:hypothetical protein
LPPIEGPKKGQKQKKLEMKKINEDLFTTSVSRKKGGRKNADFVLYTRDECAVVCEFCVFYLCENVSPSKKKEKEKKKE